jgi:ATP-dependent Lhr-like helicase
VRGHLEVVAVATAEELAAATTLPAPAIALALAALQNEGFALQGRYRPGATGPEWAARRLLARMHSYSRRWRRDGVQPVTAQDFMRFLLRWQHVAPGTQLSGEAGLVSVIEQLEGFEAAAACWERDVFARRLRHYDPTWLDRLCHDGEVAWLRLTPRPGTDATGRAGSPSKATPIAVVFRSDLPWLLDAARSGSPTAGPSLGATAEVAEVLRDRGASFASELAAATRRLPDDVERGLWDGVARGLVMCDGFGAIRGRVGSTRSRPRPRRMSRLPRTVAAPRGAAGRWSLVPPASNEVDRDELAEAVAEQLLNRWGVVFRDLAAADSLRLAWREVQWALRRLEDRGLVRGGRFVTGFGEQYALPAAADQLSHVRKAARTGERVVLNATDPLNLVGVVVPGETVPAVRTNRVVYVDGLPDSTQTSAAPS